MGMDYYGVLKVSATANEEELRRSYKKLAMRWHPDKHPSGEKGLAEAKFKQICEAYDVLSDSQKRQIYDLYGEDGLKYNVSSPNAPPRGNNPKSTSFKNHHSMNHNNNNNNNNRDYFDDEFFNDLGSDKSGSPKSDSLKNFKSDDSVKKMNGSENLDGSYRSKYSRMGSKERKAEDVENKLVCSLEDLYKGSKRKMKISRIVSDQFGKPTTVEEVLAIDIRPGWKKGTKITFPEKGNQEAGLLPGDLIFVIDEKPHSTFMRDGNDLLLSQKLTLLEALTGKTLKVTTLDGRVLDIEVSDIVKPGHEVVIAGEGMPISKEPRKRGNLRIKFDIKFPSRLSPDQKADLRRVLSRN